MADVPEFNDTAIGKTEEVHHRDDGDVGRQLHTPMHGYEIAFRHGAQRLIGLLRKLLMIGFHAGTQLLRTEAKVRVVADTVRIDVPIVRRPDIALHNHF